MIAPRRSVYKDCALRHGSRAAWRQGDVSVKSRILQEFTSLAAVASLTLMTSTVNGAHGDDPLELFARIYPVFSHDRCTGCHGRVNPELETGNNHGGGYIEPGGQPCSDCHDPPGWRTRPDLTFFNKSTKQLCQMQSAAVRSMRATPGATVKAADAAYIGHLGGDSLIGSAFIGDRGGASSTIDRPGMNRADFVKAAQEWLDAGVGCGGWEGSITQTETMGSNYGYPIQGADGAIAVKESAGREITINRIGGVARGTFKMSGHSTIVQTVHVVGEKGPCTSVNTVDTDWTSLTAKDVEVPVHVHTENDGSYTIRFAGPEAKTSTNSTTRNVNDCGFAFPSDPQDPPIELEWPTWAFTIRCPSNYGICQLFDPQHPQLSGSIARTVRDQDDGAEPYSWLQNSPASNSRSDDGSGLPFKVTVTWDLTLSN